MRRWNGWGDDTQDYELPDNAQDFLDDLVGHATPTEDVTFDEVVTAVPPTRLSEHPLITTDPAERVRHARGQSFPDWIAMRSGQIAAFPDGVAHPLTNRDVQRLIAYAKSNGVKLIPYGGGTSVVGHINPPSSDVPVLTVNMQRMNQLLHFDQTSHLATFGAGVSGPDLEAQLRARGFTLGHFPQSFELSTLGGWVVTRSSGQQSLGYGRIENLFAGGRIESPAGEFVMLPHPATAAGPDIRQMILGSEGRMGIVTEAAVRVSPLPEREEFHAVFFPDFAQGQTAVRQIMQAKIPLSMIRLSTATETTTTLALAGHERLIGTLEQLLSIRGIGDGKAMLMLGFTGSDKLVKLGRKDAIDICNDNNGVHVGRQFGNQWIKGRFRTPYLRNTLWELGYGVDTLETAVTWDNIDSTIHDIENSLHTTMAQFDEKIHVFTHLSHMYTSGASVYTTYLFRLANTPDETLHRWQQLKASASNAVVANEGTISHQHGVGTDHKPYLLAEKGALGIETIQSAINVFDPDGLMDSGNLV